MAASCSYFQSSLNIPSAEWVKRMEQDEKYWKKNTWRCNCFACEKNPFPVIVMPAIKAKGDLKEKTFFCKVCGTGVFGHNNYFIKHNDGLIFHVCSSDCAHFFNDKVNELRPKPELRIQVADDIPETVIAGNLKDDSPPKCHACDNEAIGFRNTYDKGEVPICCYEHGYGGFRDKNYENSKCVFCPSRSSTFKSIDGRFINHYSSCFKAAGLPISPPKKEETPVPKCHKCDNPAVGFRKFEGYGEVGFCSYEHASMMNCQGLISHYKNQVCAAPECFEKNGHSKQDPMCRMVSGKYAHFALGCLSEMGTPAKPPKKEEPQKICHNHHCKNKALFIVLNAVGTEYLCCSRSCADMVGPGKMFELVTCAGCDAKNTNTRCKLLNGCYFHGNRECFEKLGLPLNSNMPTTAKDPNPICLQCPNPTPPPKPVCTHCKKEAFFKMIRRKETIYICSTECFHWIPQGGDTQGDCHICKKPGACGLTLDGKIVHLYKKSCTKAALNPTPPPVVDTPIGVRDVNMCRRFDCRAEAKFLFEYTVDTSVIVKGKFCSYRCFEDNVGGLSYKISNIISLPLPSDTPSSSPSPAPACDSTPAPKPLPM